MKKDSFEFRFKWYSSLQNCPADVRLEVYDAIMSYALNGTHSELTPIASMAFSFIKDDIDKSRKDSEELGEKRRNAAMARWQKGKSEQQNTINANDANAYFAMQTDANNANAYFACTCINKEESDKENIPPTTPIKEINKEEDNIYNINNNNLLTNNIIKEKKTKTKTKKVFNEFEQQFEDFRQHYPGIKRGFDKEFDNFKKKHPNWKDLLPLLVPAVDRLIAYTEQRRARGEWVAEYPHLQTWLNQSRWEVEFPNINEQQTTNNDHYKSTAEIEYERRQAEFRDYITRKLATPYVEPDISEYY